MSIFPWCLSVKEQKLPALSTGGDYSYREPTRIDKQITDFDTIFDRTRQVYNYFIYLKEAYQHAKEQISNCVLNTSDANLTDFILSSTVGDATSDFEVFTPANVTFHCLSGRQYNFSLSLFSRNIDTFYSAVSDSLLNLLREALLNLCIGKNTQSGRALMTGSWPDSGIQNFWNTTSPIYGCSGLTALSMNGALRFSLLAPDVIVQAKHANLSPNGTTVYFLDLNNTVITRTIIGHIDSDNSSIALGDIRLYLLSSPITTLDILQVIPSDFYLKVPNGRFYTIWSNHYNNLFTTLISPADFVQGDPSTVHSKLLNDPAYQYQSANVENDSRWMPYYDNNNQEQVETSSGDSGSPLLIVHNNTLIATGIAATYTAYTNFGHYISEMNQAMAELGSQNQVTVYSSF